MRLENLRIEPTFSSYLNNDVNLKGTLGLLNLFNQYNSNNNLEIVYVKVIVLNTLYKTIVNDKDLFKLSKHIQRPCLNQNLDLLIKEGITRSS